MGRRIYLFHVLIVFLISCIQQEKRELGSNASELKPAAGGNESNNLIQLPDNPEFEKDSIIIYANDGDTLIYSKNGLLKIEQLFPVLKGAIARSPADAYSLVESERI
jgi:hypothetical protein